MLRRGGGGGGGGGKGSGGNAAAARQLLLSIFDEAVAERGQPLRRSLGFGKGGGKQGSGSRPRDGEWPCQCGFATNRPHRMACYVCGRSRDVAEVGRAAQPSGGGGRQTAKGKGQGSAKAHTVGGGDRFERGPVGADGRRPLLGGRGRDPLAGPAGGEHGKGCANGYAWDGKGPRDSALLGHAVGLANGARGTGTKGGTKASTGSDGKAGGKAPQAGDSGGARCAWTRPPAVLDEEGYELVQPRRIRADKSGPMGGGGGATPAPGGADVGGATEVEARRRWSDEDSEDEDWAGDGDCDDDCGGGDEDGYGDETPDPRQLRATYEEYARAVRDMERKGSYGPAVDTLRQARDAAEGAWRQAKSPAPLPRRLEWAETKLRKAQSALTRVRLELDRFDEETDRRRADLLARIQEAEGWYSWRQRQLDDIHDEAAERAPGRRCGGPSSDGANEVRESLRGHVLPEMQAILEEVQEGSAVHERLALLVAGLADAEAKLGAAREEDGPPHYDIWDGDSHDEGWQEGHHSTTEGTGGREQDRGSGDDNGNARPAAEWRSEGPGRWSRADAARKGAQQAQSSGAAASAETSPNQDAGSGKGGGRRRQEDAPASADNGTSPSGKGMGHGSGDDDGTERAGKHRRRQTDAEDKEDARAAADAKRAEELHRQLQMATAVQEQSYREGGGGFGSEAALSAAAQKFVHDVQRAQAQAHELGVEPCAEDGRALLQLSPTELRQWVEKHLERDDGMRD